MGDTLSCTIPLDIKDYERFTPEQRKELKRALRWSLYPSRQVPKGGKLKQWYERKLEGLVAYGIVNKEHLSKQQLNFVQLYFSQGMSTRQIGIRYHVSPRRVQQEINTVLDFILDRAPIEVLADLKPQSFKIHEDGCKWCGGDLYWDGEGAYFALGGDWCCLQCARRYDADMNLRVESS